jgi:uncharacterized protein
MPKDACKKTPVGPVSGRDGGMVLRWFGTREGLRARCLVMTAVCSALMVPAGAHAQGLFNLFGTTQAQPPADPQAGDSSGADNTTPAQAEPAVSGRRSTVARKRPSARPGEGGRGNIARSAVVARSGDAAKDSQSGDVGERLNANTITLVAGSLEATYAAVANDLAAVLDDGEHLRILPVLGKGGALNIRDVRYMKGIDLGITQTNVLDAVRRSNEIGAIADKIVYIAKLFNEEMHVIVRADAGIASLADLAGKTVNFSDAGGGTQLMARDVFARLGIEVTQVDLDQEEAVRQLKSGALAATVIVAGKPAAMLAKLRATDGLKLLPVPYPKSLQREYLPTILAPEDYPEIVERPVDTIAVGAVLIAYNWPKGSEQYRRLEKFVEAFFPRLNAFHQPPRHPKWRETNLAAVLPGWQRFAAADSWLRRNREQEGRSDFDEFLAARSSNSRSAFAAPERDHLFQEFLKWNQDRERR